MHISIRPCPRFLHSTPSRVRCPSLVDVSSSSDKSTVPPHRTHRSNYRSFPRPPAPTSPPHTTTTTQPPPSPPTPHHHVLALFSVSCPVHQLSCTRSHDHGPRTNAKNSPNTPPPPSTSTASTPPPRHTSSSTTRSLLRVKPSTRRDRAYLVRDH